MKDKIKLLIVDDHSIILAGIKNIINKISAVKILDTANSGKEALSKLKCNIIDMLITDIEMKDIGGVELAKIVKKKYPEIKIIIYTQYDKPWMTKKLLEIGVDGIVLKSIIDEIELPIAIKRANNGEKFYSDEIKNTFFNNPVKPYVEPHITEREKQVLIHICNELTTKEIANKLFLSIKAVESQRKNIMKKLSVSNQSGMVREAIKYGFYRIN